MFKYILKTHTSVLELKELNDEAIKNPNYTIACISFLLEKNTHLTSNQLDAITTVILGNAPKIEVFREYFYYIMSLPQFRHLQIRSAINNLMNKSIGHGYTSTMKNYVKDYLKSLDDITFSLYLIEATPAMRNICDLTHVRPNDFKENWFIRAIYPDRKDVSKYIVDDSVDPPEDSVFKLLQNIKTPVEYMDLEPKLRRTSFTYFLRKFTKSNVDFPNYDKFVIDMINNSPLPKIIRGIGKYDYKWLLQDKYIDQLINRVNNTRKLHMNVGELLSYSLNVLHDNYYDIKTLFMSNSYINPPKRKYTTDKKSDMYASALFELAIRILKQQGSINKKVTILVDRSGSMRGVVRGGLILTSMIQQMADVTTIMFNTSSVIVKENINDLSTLMDTIGKYRSEGGTIPATAVEYIPKDTELLIILTDEDERGSYNGKYFAETVTSKFKSMPTVIMARSGRVEYMTKSLERYGCYPSVVQIGTSNQEIAENIESIMAIISNIDGFNMLQQEYYVERLTEELNYRDESGIRYEAYTISEIMGKIDLSVHINATKSLYHKVNSSNNKSEIAAIMEDLLVLYKDDSLYNDIKEELTTLSEEISFSDKRKLRKTVQKWVDYAEVNYQMSKLETQFESWDAQVKEK